MSSSQLEMSLERQIPVLIKKTQMSGDRAGSQCGLTSLLPMSCRGRAAAFARDLHSRLRNLGAAHDDDCENSWLTKEHVHNSSSPHRPASSVQRDLDTFFDFELECESPSSPVDELDTPFSERSPTDDSDPPFYDVESDPELKEQAKQMLQLQAEKKKNGFKFSTSFFTDGSPVKQQPAPRENGHADKRLFSPITFEGCARQNSHDEVDCVIRPAPVIDTDRLSLPLNHNSTIDSDSEFESAKSEPSDEVSFTEKLTISDIGDVVENLSLREIPSLSEISNVEENNKLVDDIEICTEENPCLEITSEICSDKEISPVLEVEPTLLSAETNIDDHDDDDDRPQRVRRCSSLKTGKTPPGTPGRKKIVRFADVLGLDLADVKTFMDEIPVIPKSAYDDLTGCDFQNSPPAQRAPQRFGALTLVPLFQLPRDFNDKLELLNVCLESARVCDGVHVTICGSVRVRNLDFHKTVHIRYTMNRWKTYTDLQATYVAGSCDGYSDRFQFVLYAPCISSGQRMELAVRFQCKGQQFWDNNSGANYCFDCLALGLNAGIQQQSPGPLHPTVDWHPSFY